ncbi:MAG TPA: glycosyltransferase family 39 protein [Rubrobacter sp.]|nr:glycosyltransferase family 39 protein [Rubrobacter sp.]
MARTFGTKTTPAGEVWAFVLTVFAMSRWLFMGVGALAAAYVPEAVPAGDPLEPPGFLNYWAHWDGAWYSEIATRGYGAHAPESTAFFPLYPMLVKLGNVLPGGPALWGVLISLLCTVFALFFVYRIAEDLYGVRAARAATLALAFFPTAFFLNAVYTEALFLALTAGAVWAARVRRNLLLAGLLGALAAATRNLGMLLLIPLFFEWLRYRREFGVRGLVGIALVPAGLVGYTLFLRERFGDPLIFAGQQSAYWERELTNPLATMGRAWQTAAEGVRYVLDPSALFLGAPAGPSLAASNTLNLVFLIFFVLLILVGFAVLPPGLSIYAFLIVMLPVLTPAPDFPLMSLPRFMLGAFPVFVVLGYLLSRSRPALILSLLMCGVLGIALTALFTTWRWVA